MTKQIIALFIGAESGSPSLYLFTKTTIIVCMASEYSLSDLFLKAPIGFTEEFVLLQDCVFLRDAFNRLRNMLVAPNCRITAPCLSCKKEFPFNYKVIECKADHFSLPSTVVYYAYYFANTGKTVYCGFSLDGSENPCIIDAPLVSKFKLQHGIKYVLYDFECAGDENHHYEMLLRIDFANGRVTITKIGQHPLPYVLNSGNTSECDRILEKIGAKVDYRSASKCFYDGMYVGAFTYLRRVFERLIDYLAGPEGTDTKNMADRVKQAEDRIDPEIYDHFHPAYKMISEHVHQKSEEECRSNFGMLKALIDEQLSYMKTEAERAASRKLAKQQIDKFLKEKNKDKGN